ncbi:uncharacterized protein BJ171DRAFT_513134 [Polychytrium aggregatum]|uniref:uncharacterized protein n=1 Tax=Polychytrium aggregatum TaxID=110093 RepID=UPI0022FF3252|nr:uncharacterized protein BJ171DRAFT_513134 [Polychytrium aggregatum]KAI9202757.1 hypothetical protein BJ171DRAFT_513134 [Polychytrium aggregatum]
MPTTIRASRKFLLLVPVVVMLIVVAVMVMSEDFDPRSSFFGQQSYDRQADENDQGRQHRHGDHQQHHHDHHGAYNHGSNNPVPPVPPSYQIPDDPQFYRSQSGQDRWILKWFQNATQTRIPFAGKGVFIEFGARDGLDDSNTYLFESSFGWRGILAEAIPQEQKSIMVNRQNSAVVDAGICNTGKAQFYALDKASGWNGIVDSYDQQRKDKIDTVASKIEVFCVRLDTLVEYFGLRRVNYMSVDTEGSELSSLMTFPWSKVVVDLVGVEILVGSEPGRAENRQQIISFMGRNGYEPVHEFTVGGDTHDLFFAPGPHRSHPAPIVSDSDLFMDQSHFLEQRRMCQLLGRCL